MTDRFASLRRRCSCLCILVATGGCGGEPANDPPRVGDCMATLDQVANHPPSPFAPCAATYDAALAQAVCHTSIGVLRAGPCGGQLAVLESVGSLAQTCYYDARTRALVGAVVAASVPTFCGGDASRVFGGVVSSCELSAADLDRRCAPDAGP